MKAACAIAAGGIMNLLLKFLGREKKIYMYICTERERERERGMYGNSTAAKMAPGHLILYDPKAPAEAATTCAPTCIF